MNGTAFDLTTDRTSDEPLERSTEELRREIEDKKDAIAETLNQLDQKVERAIDWRSQVGDRPLLAVGIALSVGCLLSGFFKPKPSPGERIMEALAEGVEDAADQVRDRIETQFTWPDRGGAFKATAAALVSRAAISYVSRRLASTPRKVQSVLP